MLQAICGSPWHQSGPIFETRHPAICSLYAQEGTEPQLHICKMGVKVPAFPGYDKERESYVTQENLKKVANLHNLG